MIIDLTLPIVHGMSVFPGDPPVVFHSVSSHDREGYSVHALSFGTHTGTHIDAPFHADSNGITVDHAAILDATVGEAVVFDVRNTLENGEITPESLRYPLQTIGEGDRIILATGWSDFFASADYFNTFPSVSVQLARILAEKKISLLGIDTPSLNLVYDKEVHTTLLSAGCVIVENLANLRSIKTRRIFFSAAPLKLMGIDGSPVRAYAITIDT